MNSNRVQISDRNEKIFLLLILSFGAIFRLVAAFTLSLSNDELSALTRARHDTFSEMIVSGVLIDFHPAGIQSFIFYWIRLLGDAPFMLRLPFLISGVVSTYLVFAIGKRWFSPFTGLFAAVIFSVFQFSIFYSLFARPYSPGLLFGLIATYSWTKLFFPIVDGKNSGSSLFWWVVFTISMIACTHTHYFSFVFAGSLGIAGLILMRKKLIRPYLVSGVLIVLAFIPEWEIFQVQIATGDIGGWLAPPGKWYLPEFIQHVFNDSLILAAAVSILFGCGVIVTLLRHCWTKFHSISLFLFLFSFLTAYLYSIFRHPVIQFSTLFFTLPFLLILIGQFIEQLFFRVKKFYLIIPVFLISGTLHTLFAKGFFHRAHYGVFREIAEDIKYWQETLGKDSVPVVLNVINPEYMNYYFRRLNYHPEMLQWKIEKREEIQKFKSALESLKAPYFCFAWSNSEHPYEIIRMLREYYPVVLKKEVYFNSASYLFARKGKSVVSEPRLQIRYDFDSGIWRNRNDLSSDTSNAYLLDSLQEFSPGFQTSFDKLPYGNFSILTAHLGFRSTQTDLNATVVISFDSSGVPKEYFSLDLDECNLERGNWQSAYLSRIITNDIDKNLTLNIYVYNRDHRNFELNNFEITIEDWDDPYQSGH